MFFDWLSLEQDFGYQLPIIGDVAYQRIFLETGEASSLSQPAYKHSGSFCDSVLIKISGSVLKMSGNPSRWGRIENLFGLRTVDNCVDVYNKILTELNLPVFTKCTQLMFRSPKGSKIETFSDGAIIKELHITSNRMVGKGNENDYLAGLSTLNYRYSVPRLHSNGQSVDWLSKNGNAHLIYPTVYNKSHELELHSITKIKNKFGENSKEFKYLNEVIEYCKNNGVVRFEQKLKSRFLKRENLHYWGLSDYTRLNNLHNEFLDLDKKLSVNAMDFETISEQLIRCGVVDTTRSANTTAMYAIQWMHGQTFDFNKKAVQTHRARLRKIGIDIAQRCNLAKFSPVTVREIRKVEVSDCQIPNWYQMPQIFRLAS
ncbi:MAG: hypothetical protein J6569_04655 [Gilliamella sp.]|uniref:phage/plasmid replication domain-containing protein n=1 Tax=Gilliamella sp. TaxID=1891236 RepID=UPI0025ED28D5|nr:phage/plasmid replication protein [Gilliamella sp.]MCO6539410.1 hypothetical protein [Gilliamella sp.]